MALRDWNNDGKNDFIEHTIINDEIDNENDDHSHNNYYKQTNKGEISTFGRILSVILGLVLTAVVFTIFDIEVDKVPTLIIIIMWFINTTIAMVIAAFLGI